MRPLGRQTVGIDPRLERDALDRAHAVVARHAPRFVARALEAVRGPGKRWLRIPLGLFFFACGLLWFLPVVGLEFFPLAFLVLAEDVPFLRKPVGRGVLWMMLRFLRMRRWWQKRRMPRG